MWVFRILGARSIYVVALVFVLSLFVTICLMLLHHLLHILSNASNSGEIARLECSGKSLEHGHTLCELVIRRLVDSFDHFGGKLGDDLIEGDCTVPISIKLSKDFLKPRIDLSLVLGDLVSCTHGGRNLLHESENFLLVKSA